MNEEKLLKMTKASEEADKHSTRIMKLDEFIVIADLDISVEEAREE